MAISINATYDHIDHICLVMIDRSMWFAKSYDALADDNFAPLVQKYPWLPQKQNDFRKPVVFAFSYAQRVFLCSAMELCLLHQYANAVAIIEQEWPSRVHQLKHLLEELKRYKIKSWAEWDRLQWEAKIEKLRKLSFSNLRAASTLFGDIYGSDCFDLAWGEKEHKRLDEQYSEYQTLRNGIVHRGGELSSGAKIEATEADIAKTFEDAQRFRDAIHQLSRWCRAWWLERVVHS